MPFSRRLRVSPVARVPPVNAVPVAPADFLSRLREACDRSIVLVAVTDWLFAVGRYYIDFHEVSDEEVRAELEREGEAP